MDKWLNDMSNNKLKEKISLNCRKVITGIKNYDLNELKNILDTYIYNKNDNNYNGMPVYKIIDDKELPGEKFENYPKNINISYWNFRGYLKNSNIRIEVSNLGRVKIDNIVQQQNEEKYGYLYVLINKKPYFVYRLVGETWCPCPVEKTNSMWHVHHITNNGYDNRPENLIWVNSVEHKYIESSYNIKKRINEIKESLFLKLDEMININSNEDILKEIFRDIILIGNHNDKNRIEQYISIINIDLTKMKNILLKNIGIKI